MSKYFSFCNKNKKQQKQRNKKESLKKTFCLSLKYLVAILVLGLFSFRILMGNTGIVKGFEISELEREISSLQTEQKVLLQQTENLKQTTNIEDRLNELGLVVMGNVDYVGGNYGIAMVK